MAYANYANTYNNPTTNKGCKFRRKVCTEGYYNYGDGAAHTYGWSCTQSYSNYQNLRHAPPLSFTPTASNVTADTILSPLAVIQALRADLKKLTDPSAADSTVDKQKFVTTGGSYIVSDDVDDPGSFTYNVDANFAAGSLVDKRQIQELVTITTNLWNQIDGSATTWPPDGTTGDANPWVNASDFNMIKTRITTLAGKLGYQASYQDTTCPANVTLTNYVNLSTAALTPTYADRGCQDTSSYLDAYYNGTTRSGTNCTEAYS